MNRSSAKFITEGLQNSSILKIKEVTIMSETETDNFFRYRVLHVQYGNDHVKEALLKEATEQGQDTKTKNFCAHLSLPMIEDINRVCGMFRISKRRFMELAVADAIAKADRISDEEGLWQHLEYMQELANETGAPVIA